MRGYSSIILFSITSLGLYPNRRRSKQEDTKRSSGMSWRFRQSFKLIPGLKLNLGKTGLSLSFGGAPLTLNVGPRGVYGTASIPGTGIQFRQRLGGGSGTFAGSPPNSPPQLPGPTFPPSLDDSPMQEIRSAGTELLTSEGLQELKRWLQTAYEEHEAISHELTSARKADARCSKRYASWNSGFLFKKVFKKSFEKRRVLAEEASAKRQELEEQLRLTAIAAQIDIATEQAGLFFRMRDDFAQLSESAAIWDITSQRATNRIRERTVAARTINREPVKFALASCDLIRWEHTIPHLQNINGGDLFLYPGFIIYRAAKTAFSVIDYHDVNLECRSTRFVEDQNIPSDANIVGQAWAKSNKDGSRDQRFANNYQIPIVEYGALLMKSDTGLWEEFQISNLRWVMQFGDAFKAFAKSFSKQSTPGIKALDSGQRHLQQASPRQSNDISFSCPKCQQHLVVDEAGAGIQVPCPNCKTSITIPSKESLMLESLTPKAKRLAAEKPKAWEYLLFFEVLSDELERRYKAAETAEVMSLTKPSERVAGDVSQAIGLLQTVLEDFTQMIRELEDLLNVSANAAFGPPGQAGDIEKIIRVAKEFAGVYERMLKCMYRLHQETFSGPAAKVAIENEKALRPILEKIRRFPAESVQQIENAFAQPNESGTPVTLNLRLQLNPGDMRDCIAAIEKLRQRIT